VGAVRARVGADFRRRWLAWVALTLAIGLAGAVVLTAAAGARRTATAFDRFLAQGHAEDLYFSIGRPTDPEMMQAAHEIEALPQVEAASSVAAMVVYERALEAPYQFAGIDERYGNAIDRPNVVQGRRPDPDRADELLVNRTFAREADVGAGDTIDMYAFEPSEIEVASPKQSDATKVRMKIVGVGVYPNEVVATAEYDALPFAYFTPAFLREHPKETQEYGFEVVRLKHGRADLAEFRKGLASVLRAHGGDPNDMFFTDRTEAYSQVQRAIQPQAIALAVFAALVAFAFVMIVVQVLARQIFLDARDYRTLATLGMTRRQRFATAMTRVLVVSVAGAIVAVIGAVLASPLMPIGPARLAEPNRGFAVNGVLLVGALVLIPLVIALLTAIPAWRAAAAGTAERPVRSRRRRTADGLAAGGVAPSIVIGVRNGMDSGSGRGRVPVRSAVVVSGLAIALVVGTVGFATNLDRLANTPRLYGWNWSFIAGNGFFPVHVKETMAGLRGVPGVDAVGGATYNSIEIEGRPVATVGIDGLRGHVFPTMLEGRAPRGKDEVVLGTRTLRRADRGVGDTVRVTISGRARTVRVVGRAVFPNLGAGSFSPTNLGEGAAMTVDGLDVAPGADGGRYSVLLIRMRPGTDLGVAQRQLSKVLRPMEFCGGDSGCVQLATRPGDVSNYTRVRGTGVVLSAALALIALGFLVHVLVSSVRRRRRDLAVFKTLGFARRQVAATSVWQAVTMAALALVIGIPVGLTVSALVWRAFAEALGIAPGGILPTAVFLAIPVVLGLAVVVAVVPSLLAARTRPATVLRSE
jgi:ABC-type lipoprotein release transport system permease subunit